MKVRIIFLTCILFFINLTLSAQFKYGIRGGINSSSVTLANNSFFIDNSEYPEIRDEYEINYNTGSLGFHIGGLLQYYFLTDAFVQPELLYTSVKNDIQIIYHTWVPDGDFGHNEETPYSGQQKFNKLILPVMVGYRFGPLRLSAGPVASMLINSKSDLLEERQIEQQFLNSHFGYQLGIGIELASLDLDIKYEGHLSSMSDGITIRGNSFDFDQRMGQWMLTIAFVLGNE